MKTSCAFAVKGLLPAAFAIGAIGTALPATAVTASYNATVGGGNSVAGSGTSGSFTSTIALPKFQPVGGEVLSGITLEFTGVLDLQNAVMSNVPFIPTSVTTQFDGSLSLTQTITGTMTHNLPTGSVGVTIPGAPLFGTSQSTADYNPGMFAITEVVPSADFGAFIGSGNISGLAITAHDSFSSDAFSLLGVGNFNHYSGSLARGAHAEVIYTAVPEPGVVSLATTAISLGGAFSVRRRRK